MIETTKKHHLKVDQEYAEKWAVLNGFVNSNGNNWHKGRCNLSIHDSGFRVMGEWTEYHELDMYAPHAPSPTFNFVEKFVGRFEPILKIELHE